MQSARPVLVVSSDEQILDSLQESLNMIGIQHGVARTCWQAREALNSPQPPLVVFTDAFISDGSCKTVLNIAARSEAPAKVIVIAQKMDYELFLDALDAGAADFVTPPFLAEDIVWLICSVRVNSPNPRLRPSQNPVAA